jgi:hypothetical protein
MKVGERTPLEFNNFHERHPRALWVFGQVLQLTAQEPLKLNRKAPPEFWSMPGEKYMSDIVVTVTTQGLPECGLVVLVRSFAPAWTPVRALAPVGAPWVTVASHTSRVDGAEAGRRKGDEYLGMLGNGGRYVMMSATKAGVDELPRITGV